MIEEHSQAAPPARLESASLLETDAPAQPVPPEPAKLNKASRVRMGLVMGAIVSGLVLAGGWIWATAGLIGCWIAFEELVAIMAAKHIHPSRLIVGVTGIVMWLLIALHLQKYMLITVTIGVMASFFRLLFRHPRASISDIGATLLALFYLAFLPFHLILLRNLGADVQPNPLLQPGLGYLFLTCLIISAGDVGAYYAGRKFGKVPLSPTLSPKKTREGLIGGLVAGILLGQITAALIHFPAWHALILSPLLVLVGTLGDLVESLIKRDAGVKDSGQLLQGHGGVLDRIDSYIFSGAVSYYYIYWFVLQKGLFQDVMNWLGTLT
jgi:phosphatidate cytidylyltransferase